MLRAFRLQLLCCWIVLGMLAGCGSPAVPQNQNLLEKTPDTSGPTATTAVNVPELPGRLLFVQDGTIWLWQGSRRRPLLGSGDAVQPAWSPNGSQIAFAQMGESFTDIAVADADGSNVMRLTDNGSRYTSQSNERIHDTMWAFYPSWTPDGTSLVVTSQYGPPVGEPAVEYNMSLFDINVSTKGRSQLYADNAAHAGRAVYSPDGSVIVFVRSPLQNDAESRLSIITLETGQVDELASAPVSSYDPVFSPNGQWLAFAAREGKATDLWVVPATSAQGMQAQPVRLTSLGSARAPTFSPDGRMIAFLAIPPEKSGFELWVADIQPGPNGGLQLSNQRQLTDGMQLDPDSGLSWAS